MREVEGDFIIEVRVGGRFRPASGRKYGWGSHQAGILLLIGAHQVTHCRGARLSEGKPYQYLTGGFSNGTRTRGHSFGDAVTPLGETIFLRLERQGQRLVLKVSPNGSVWKKKLESDRDIFHVPKRVKVGVFAESTADGSLKAVFDQFKLTPLSSKTR
jgi:regulation of enolase protein 1 (concanavalin A-like superfamily)